MTVRIADFKVAAHLRAVFVVFALHCFLIQPDTWFAHVDIGQAINVLTDLLLEIFRDLLPKGIIAVPVELRVTNCHAACPAVITGQFSRTAAFVNDGEIFQDSEFPMMGQQAERIKKPNQPR